MGPPVLLVSLSETVKISVSLPGNEGSSKALPSLTTALSTDTVIASVIGPVPLSPPGMPSASVPPAVIGPGPAVTISVSSPSSPPPVAVVRDRVALAVVPSALTKSVIDVGSVPPTKSAAVAVPL